MTIVERALQNIVQRTVANGLLKTNRWILRPTAAELRAWIRRRALSSHALSFLITRYSAAHEPLTSLLRLLCWRRLCFRFTRILVCGFLCSGGGLLGG